MAYKRCSASCISFAVHTVGISADVSEDQKTATRYYTIRIAVPDNEIVRLGGLKLVPGMPVEAFIQTTPRTMISYLVRPIHDQVIRAFREK